MSRKQIVKCECGAQYKVPIDLAGKKAKCKKCDRSFVIPKAESAPKSSLAPTPISPNTTDPSVAAGAAASLLNPYGSLDQDDSASVRSCPSCQRNIGKGKVVCIYCGYHTDLGRKLHVEASEPEDSGTAAAQDLEIGDVVPGLTGVFAILAAVGLIVVTAALNSQFEGPAFLAYFYVWFVLSALAVVVARKALLDHDIFNDAAVIALLGMGGARIYYSVTHERYKFLFLILGMLVVFGVFFISRVRGRDSDDSPFVNSAGGLAVGPFVFLSACAAMVLGMIYFVEPIRKVTADFLVYVVFGAFFAVSSGISKVTGHQFNSSGSSFGFGGYSSCSSCGGGCGGGCGGCGG